MKVETCITISEDLLKELDEFSNGDDNRSEFVEKALRKYLDDLKFRRRVNENAEKEKEIINRMTVEQREEIEDNIRFVAELNLKALNK
jgi:metal-responsive CopG/Arc/MetJ family transcriptional regulator